MPTISKDLLSQKLQTLNNSQQAIEGLSSWCLFYKSDAKSVVEVWEKEFLAAAPPLKLAMLYVANHLLQESRKKGREFTEEFIKVLPKAMKHAQRNGDEKMKKSVVRLLDIWDERKVFGSSHMKTFKEIALGEKSHVHHISRSPRSSKIPPTPPALAPLADALQYVEQANQKASEAMNKSMSGIRPGLVNDGSPVELQSGLDLLRQYSAALEAEIAGRNRVLSVLHSLVTQQKDALTRNDENLNMCAIQRENVERRLALLTAQGVGIATSMPLPSTHHGPTPIPLTPAAPPPARPIDPPTTMSVVSTGVPPQVPHTSSSYMYPNSGILPNIPPAFPHTTSTAPSTTPGFPPYSAPNNGTQHYSPQAPRPDSPMPPPLSPDEASPPSNPTALPPMLDADLLASLAEKLANSDQSAVLLAQALESMPAAEREHLSVSVPLMSAPEGSGTPVAPEGGSGTPTAPDMDEGDDDVPYDPEYPD